MLIHIGFGAVNFLFAFPAVFTIDTCESADSMLMLMNSRKKESLVAHLS